MKYVIAAVVLIASTLPAAAFTPGDVEKAEGVLSRMTLERAAFVTCSEPGETREFLKTNWGKELADAVQLMTDTGFPAEFVAAAPTRFDLAAATPSFASEEARKQFCAVLGDWQRRWELFYVVSPAMELKKVLQP